MLVTDQLGEEELVSRRLLRSGWLVRKWWTQHILNLNKEGISKSNTLYYFSTIHRQRASSSDEAHQTSPIHGTGLILFIALSYAKEYFMVGTQFPKTWLCPLSRCRLILPISPIPLVSNKASSACWSLGASYQRCVCGKRVERRVYIYEVTPNPPRKAHQEPPSCVHIPMKAKPTRQAYRNRTFICDKRKCDCCLCEKRGKNKDKNTTSKLRRGLVGIESKITGP